MMLKYALNQINQCFLSLVIDLCQLAVNEIHTNHRLYLRIMENATFEDFQKIDLRVGTILKADSFPEARKPAYKLTIDFGELGIKLSSAQITKRYKAEELIGRQIVAVFNFPPKKVAGFKSEVLILGATPDADDVVLLSPENELPNGSVVA